MSIGPEASMTMPPQMGAYPDSITVGGEAPPQEQAPEAPASPDEKIKRIVEMAAQILSDDGLDEVEKQFLAQIALLGQKALGARQKERDGLIGGKSTPSALRTGLGG